MKKIVSKMVSAAAGIAVCMCVTGCSGNRDRVLRLAFSPYQEPESIITATAPLEELLKKTLAEKGFPLEKVEMTVGTSYEAVGEALSAGSADAGFISGGTYVLFDDEVDVLLTALRSGINKDSDNPADWNDGTVEKETGDMAMAYRSILLAGPSQKGQELAAKVNAGQKLSWEDLNSAKWAVMSPASASGYMYPSLWLQTGYGKSLQDLEAVIRSDSYSTSLARLAAGQVDIMVSYGHIRIKNEPLWQSKFGGTAPIAEQTNVIGVTPPIFNDTVSVSKKSKVMTPEFKKAFAESMIEIGNTPEGKKIIAAFSQKGYRMADPSDYDDERSVQKMIRSF